MTPVQVEELMEWVDARCEAAEAEYMRDSAHLQKKADDLKNTLMRSLEPIESHLTRVNRSFDTLIRAIVREGYSVHVDPDGNYSIEQRADET